MGLKTPQAREGMVVAILGAPGSGKTTLGMRLKRLDPKFTRLVSIGQQLRESGNNTSRRRFLTARYILHRAGRSVLCVPNEVPKAGAHKLRADYHGECHLLFFRRSQSRNEKNIGDRLHQGRRWGGFPYRRNFFAAKLLALVTRNSSAVIAQSEKSNWAMVTAVFRRTLEALEADSCKGAATPCNGLSRAA